MSVKLIQTSTFDEAREERRNLIAKWRKGTKAQRRKASVLRRCRKRRRCAKKYCPVCEWLKQPVAVQPDVDFSVIDIAPGAIKIEGARRAVNEEKLHALSVSMSQIGMRTPPIVRKTGNDIFLVSGLHRCEAAKLLGWSTIKCFVLTGTSADARVVQLHDDVYRHELGVIERAEAVNELRRLMVKKLKVPQDAGPGGRQPKEAGINKTANALGLSPDDVSRCKAIAEISAEAKAEALARKLDQKALLEIAKCASAEEQLAAVKAIKPNRARTGRSASGKSRGAKTDAAKNQKDPEQATEASAADREEGTDKKRDPQAAAKSPDFPTVDSPPTAPKHDDLDIPPFLDRRLSQEIAGSFSDLTAAWHAATQFKRAWYEATAEAREQFITDVLGGYVQR